VDPDHVPGRQPACPQPLPTARRCGAGPPAQVDHSATCLTPPSVPRRPTTGHRGLRSTSPSCVVPTDPSRSWTRSSEQDGIDRQGGDGPALPVTRSSACTTITCVSHCSSVAAERPSTTATTRSTSTAGCGVARSAQSGGTGSVDGERTSARYLATNGRHSPGNGRPRCPQGGALRGSGFSAADSGTPVTDLLTRGRLEGCRHIEKRDDQPAGRQALRPVGVAERSTQG
jgi:hypothetical protein